MGDTHPRVCGCCRDMMFETTFQAAASGSVKLGDKADAATPTALQVTATTASGVAEVVGMDGTAAGEQRARHDSLLWSTSKPRAGGGG